MRRSRWNSYASLVIPISFRNPYRSVWRIYGIHSCVSAQSVYASVHLYARKGLYFLKHATTVTPSAAPLTFSPARFKSRSQIGLSDLWRALLLELLLVLHAKHATLPTANYTNKYNKQWSELRLTRDPLQKNLILKIIYFLSINPEIVIWSIFTSQMAKKYKLL